MLNSITSVSGDVFANGMNGHHSLFKVVVIIYSFCNQQDVMIVPATWLISIRIELLSFEFRITFL